MIAVEIPAALAADPQVVPVDPPGLCDSCEAHRSERHVDDGRWHDSCWACRDRRVNGGVGLCPGCRKRDLSALVGQRVALAWRETCPTCSGRGEVDIDGRGGFIMPCGACGVPDAEVTEENCWENGSGERMVVGWTAEVEAVVPIVAEQEFRDEAAVVACIQYAFDVKFPAWRRSRLVVFLPGHDGTGRDLDALSELADWSPGRYALVLRDVSRQGILVATDLHGGPVPVRPFSGFAELDQVLSGSADTDRPGGGS